MPNEHVPFQCSADENWNVIAKGKYIHPQIRFKYFYRVVLYKLCAQFSEAFSVCWFWRVSRKKKKSVVSVSWKKSGSILLPQMMQSHLWIQIRLNVILLLITSLSSSMNPVLSSKQSGVSAKIPVKCSNSWKNKGTEKVFSVTPPAAGTVRTWENFQILKSKSFTSRRT